MLKRILFLFALALMASPLLFAQVTTSSINGTVKGSADEALVGATIVATHLPTGTRYATTSRGGGTFGIQNMKPGGPYLIEVTFVGHDPEKYENIFLQLAESFILNSNLKKTNATLENVVLTTSRRNVFNPNRTGAVTNIGIRQITQLPSISRSINDYTRATPQSNGVSIGGGNYRQNNFTVDGADFNNTFGISTGAGNLPAGGSPISIDAIDEISVNITPFDVRQSGFIGAGINAVTRSGTNTFSGSVYEYFRNERDRGRKVEKTFFTRPLEQFKQKGIRFGGPIIRNKLFFFLNFETDNIPVTVQSNFASTAGAPYGSAGNIARPTADSLNAISQFLFNKYGYITGVFDNYTVPKTSKKFMGRIDWNINSKNRVNFRYSQVEGGTPTPPSTSFGGITPTGSAPSGGGRTALTALWFKNSNYFQGFNFYSFSGELNSNISKGVSNTLRGSYTYQNESRTSDSQVFPFVDILSTSGGVSGPAVYTSFGYEPFTFGNLRKVKTYSFVDNITWRTNKHSWMAGVQADFSKTVNGFQRAGTSYYQFATWNDFATGQLPVAFGYTYSLSKGFVQAFPSFRSTQFSAYAQDEITINKNLRLTIGLRLDQTGYPSVKEIKTHPLIAALTFANGMTVNTGALPDKKITWSPRVGFNWDVYGDRSLQVRGGTGIFAGRVPFVWIVSQSGDAGLLQVTQSFSGGNVPGPFNPNPRAYYPATPPPAGTVIPSLIEIVDPKYKNPQSWKSSLAMDTKLPFGLIASIEAIFNRDLTTPYFKNINLVGATPLNVSGYPDNRMIYPFAVADVPVTIPPTPPSTTNVAQFITRITSAGFVTLSPVGSNGKYPVGTSPFNVYDITNGTRGYYFSITGKIEKPFSKGFFASLAYTKSLAGNLFDGSGDQPGSAWQGIQTVNGSNTPTLGYASYVVPDRLVATVSYRKEYFKHLATNISFIYQGAIDYRFTYTYSTDFNRDGTTGNDLIYIPTVAEVQAMTFTSQTVNGIVYDANATLKQQNQLFEAYIQQDKYLRKHRGQYAERNGATAPWRNQVDARFMQDLFVKAGKSRNTLQFTIDVFNLGNLLNPSWGKVKATNASAILVPTNQNSLVASGTVVPTFRLNTSQGQIVTRTFRDVISTASTYSVQFGVRYLFN